MAGNLGAVAYNQTINTTIYSTCNKPQFDRLLAAHNINNRTTTFLSVLSRNNIISMVGLEPTPLVT